MANPRIDPGLVRRRVQHALGRLGRIELAEQQLEIDGADRPGAPDLWPERDERLRGVRDPVAKRLRAVLRVDELPPGDIVEFALAPGLAGGQQVQQPLEQKANVLAG